VKSVDAALLVMVLVAAFMLASGVSRTTDQWLHFASGRALLNGEYSLGTDPFSHATAGRTWVNHAWLSSVAAYLLYQADTSGFVVVAVKAFLFAATFGVVFLIRRSGQTIWPWVVATAVAVVAAAPHAQLRPLVVSGLFLAVTLYLVLGRDWKASAKLPLAAVGLLFWVWASSDVWFFLGPLTILLVLVGEVVQNAVWKKAEPTDDAVAVPHLLKALAVGVVACSLTPHHVRVWQLPAELGFHLPTNFQTDFDLAAFALSPTDKSYFDRPTRGKSVNGAAFAGLLVGGGIVVAITGLARLRVAHLLLWIAFAGLALLQQRAILFFSVVAVPVFATGLSALIDGVKLGPADGPRANLLLMLSSLGRILGLPATLLFVAAAYPGWLLPQPGHPSLTPRVAWAVEPDPGLKRTAEMLGRWRESGRLPADYRGLIVNTELANHVAWFAPKEKVFVNGRYAFHGPELADFLKVRRVFLDRQQPIDAVEIEAVHEVAQKHDLAYVAFAGIGYPPLNVDMLPLYQLTAPEGGYALWHVDGRAVVLGDLQAKNYRAAVFQELAFNPARLGFDPNAAAVLPPPPPGMPKVAAEPSFLDPFFQPVPAVPPHEALDAATWLNIGDEYARRDYRGRVGDRVLLDDQTIRMIGWPWFGGAVGNPLLASAAQNGGYRTPDVAVAYNVLALRAAWQAIAANPDDPFGYYNLSQVCGATPFGVPGRNVLGGRNAIPGMRGDIKQQLEVAGLRQFIDRLPPPGAVSRGVARIGQEAAYRLHLLYQPDQASQAGQAVLPESASQMLIRAREYYEASDLPARMPEEHDRRKKDFEARLKNLERLVIPANDNFQQFKNLDLPAQVRGAIERNLLVQAAEKFAEAWRTQNLGPDPQKLTLQMVRSFVILGQCDQADFYLTQVEDAIAELRAKGDAKVEGVAQVVDGFRFQLWQLRGDYAKAGEALEKAIRLPPLTESEKEAVRAAVAKPTLAAYQDYLGGFDQNGLINGPAMSLLGGPGLFGQTHVQFSIDKWQQHADFFIQRGLQLLLEGKVAEAKVRFEQALRPEKVEMPAYMPQRQLAEQYLRLIEEGPR
jgi:tetratricopeptide (TPR) repeat protein